MRPVFRIALGAVALALPGCRGATAPDPNFLSNTWFQSAQFTDAAQGDTHIQIGTFSWVQNGNSFSGTGKSDEATCHHTATNTNYTGPLTDTASFAVTNGLLAGDAISFDTPLCHYQGTFAPGSRTRMTGTATCSFTSNGTSYDFTGGWQVDNRNR
jgi:hypothetical protein